MAEVAIKPPSLHLGEPEDGALVGAVAGVQGLAQGGVDGGCGAIGGEGGQVEVGHGSATFRGRSGSLFCKAKI